jgi:hypothetical protein
MGPLLGSLRQARLGVGRTGGAQDARGCLSPAVSDECRARGHGGGVSRASVVELRLAEEAVLVDAATVNAEDL